MLLRSGSRVNESGLLAEFVEQNVTSFVIKCLGGMLMAAAAFGWLAILTWSATDYGFQPVLDGVGESVGVTRQINRLLSDFLFQTFGMASVLAILPVAFWGWELYRFEVIRDLSIRMFMWPISALAFAATFSSAPTIESWPLHHGYGGLFGDFLYGFLSQLLDTFDAGTSGMVGAAAFAITAIATLMRAIDVTRQDLLLVFERSGAGRLNGVRGAKKFAGRMLGRAGALGRRARSAKVHNPAPKMAEGLEKMFGRYAKDAAPPDSDDFSDEFQDWSDGDDAVPDNDGIVPIDGLEPDAESESIARRFAPQKAVKNSAKKQSSKALAKGDRKEPVFEPLPAEESKKRASRKAGRKFDYPSIKLLRRPEASKQRPEFTQSILRGNAQLLEEVLADFGVKGRIKNVRPGPVITLYELEPARGVKASRVIGLADDIARSMSSISARVAVIPGRNAIGIELPNMRRETVYLRELLSSDEFASRDDGLLVALGKSIDGQPAFADLVQMPHLLVAGTTGAGKSVGVNAMILSLLYRLSPDDCRFIMIDPKMLELSIYDGIPHLLTPVVTDPKKAVTALNWVVREMEERYKRMSKLGVRGMQAYNSRVRSAQQTGEKINRRVQTGFDQETGDARYEMQTVDVAPMPYIVVVIDEMADLMLTAGKEIEASVQRLAQMARAAGIHLITATQRPSVDVITGVIKANLPTRISYKVASSTDSRTILGQQGAEQLLGKGDLLFSSGGGQMTRVHGPLVSEEEVEQIVAHWQKQAPTTYVPGITDEPQSDGSSGRERDGQNGDDLYDKAVALVMRDQKISTSYIQRRLSIGYNRAADIVERMEKGGLISAPNKAGKRDILVEHG